MQRRVDGFAGPSSSGEAGRCTAQKRPAFGAFCAMRALHGTSSRAVAVARLLSDRQFREQGSRKTVCPFLLRPDAGVHVAGLLSPRFELRIDFPRLRRLIHSRSGSLALRHGLALRHLLLGCPGILRVAGTAPPREIGGLSVLAASNPAGASGQFRTAEDPIRRVPLPDFMPKCARSHIICSRK